jgi:hypothetical protein
MVPSHAIVSRLARGDRGEARVELALAVVAAIGGIAREHRIGELARGHGLDACAEARGLRAGQLEFP